VWSTPIPQFAPHHHFVPRCRAMIAPAPTCSPPYFLMPRNLGFESRPLEDEPPCFLDAKRTEIRENAQARDRDEVSGRPPGEEVGEVGNEVRTRKNRGWIAREIRVRPGACADRADPRLCPPRTVRRAGQGRRERASAERLAQALHLRAQGVWPA
jgi:hypothetical protein